MSDLVDHLIGVRDNCVKLLKGLQAFIVVAQSLINKTKVIDGLNAISFYTNSFQEELFRTVIVLVYEETVPLVYQGLRVVSIMLDREITELFSSLEVILKEVQEGDVVGSHGHHDLVLLLKGLERFDGSLDLLVLDVVNGLGDLHLALDLWEISCLESFNHVVVTDDHILLYDRGD